MNGNTIQLLLEIQYRREESVQEVPGVYGRKLSDTDVEAATGPTSCEQRRIVGWCGCWRLSGALSSWNHQKKKERVFLLGEVRSRTVTLDFQSLVCLGDWLKELFGRQSWKAKESRRTGNFPRRKSWRWTSPLSSCADGREGEILDEQICLEFRVKRWVYDIWKQGQVTQVVRLCREYIRRSKVQLELNLNSAAKETKKCFYKYICNKMKG